MEHVEPCDWSIMDLFMPVELREAVLPQRVDSELVLRSYIEAYSEAEPRLLGLKSPTESVMFIGVSGPLAGLLYFENPKKGYSCFAKPDQEYSVNDAFFIGEGVPTRFPARYLMPLSVALSIVLHYFSTHQLADWVTWE